jgi:hypothetical protein
MFDFIKFWKKSCNFCQRKISSNETEYHKECYNFLLNSGLNIRKKKKENEISKETLFLVELDKHFSAKNFFR